MRALGADSIPQEDGRVQTPHRALAQLTTSELTELDGWFARRSPTPTRLKDSDFYVDLIFYAGILAYLTLARFLPAWLVAGFVILGGAAWRRFLEVLDWKWIFSLFPTMLLRILEDFTGKLRS